MRWLQQIHKAVKGRLTANMALPYHPMVYHQFPIRAHKWPIPGSSTSQISDWIYSYLGHYSVLADLTVRAGKSRYPMYPKNHMLCHTALELRQLAETCVWQLSPLATSCQQQEDFIGKPSKLSRSTNIRQAHRSVLWRSMIKIRFSLLDSGKDQRGMDAYMG